MRVNPRWNLAVASVVATGAMCAALPGCSRGDVAASLGDAAGEEPPTRGGGAVESLPWRLKPHSADMPPAELAGFIGVFAPLPDTPDHVLIWREQETGPLRWVTSTVRRRGPWIRTDTIDGAVTGSRYLHVPTGVVVSAGRNQDGPVRYFEIRASERARANSDIEYPGSVTGEAGAFSGESCRWWEVYRGLSDGQPTFRRQACVTGDGIEVGSRTLGRDGEAWPSSSASATGLIRRPVERDEVQPVLPHRDVWLGEALAAPARSSTGNFAVLLATPDGARKMVIRRRGSWRGVQERNQNGSMSFSAHAEGGLAVAAVIGPDGQPTSLAYRQQPNTGQQAPAPVDAPGETVLGLSCGWWDVAPGVSDGGRQECRTRDGLPLKVRIYNRFGFTELVAVRLDRNPGSVEDVMPPAPLLDLANWGVTR